MTRTAPAAAAGVLAATLAVAVLWVSAPPTSVPTVRRTIPPPTELPAGDAPGAAGWRWSTRPGIRPDTDNYTALTPQRVNRAQLGTLPVGIEVQTLRILATGASPNAVPTAILWAANNSGEQCLGRWSEGAAVEFACPGQPVPGVDLDRDAVVVVAWQIEVSYQDVTSYSLQVVGVARGDVQQIRLATDVSRAVLYTRGSSWGQFLTSVAAPRPFAGRIEAVGANGQVLDSVPLEAPVERPAN